MDEIADLRRQPVPVFRSPEGEERGGEPLSAAFLKHADEQTVIALTAVFEALRQWSPAPCFRDWGVLAAPRYFGRFAMAAALQRYQAEGAWGVSPHMIPHRSLHAVSGTISQALKIHGPNFGTSGEADALLTALALMHGKRLPGVWVVLTQFDPELPPDETGKPPSGCFLDALAVALTLPGQGPDGGTGVQLTLNVSEIHPNAATPEDSPPLLLGLLRDLFTRLSAGERSDVQTQTLSCSLGARFSLELSYPAVDLESEPAPVLLPGPGSLALEHRPRRSA